MSAHEVIPRVSVPVPPPDRAFGFMVATLSVMVGLAPLVYGATVRPVALALGGVFLLAALAAPAALRPLTRLWMKLGSLLQRIASPVVLAVLLFLVITPIGILIRLLGMDPLRLRRESQEESYWIRRTPASPVTGSMRNQF